MSSFHHSALTESSSSYTISIHTRAVVKALAAEGCHVVLADTNVSAMKSVASDHSQTTLCVECNVADPSSVKALIEQADSAFSTSTTSTSHQPATLLVNCAGITRDNWMARMSLKEWHDVLDVNLTATFLTCRHMLDQERMKRMIGLPQAIVNVGSIVSVQGNLGQVNYSASKGGVLGLTRSLAKEVASRNVRVNAVIPGFIDTPMAQAVPEQVKQQIIPKIPLGRFGEPSEVANLVCFLLSPRSSYITGEAVTVSGMISL